MKKNFVLLLLILASWPTLSRAQIISNDEDLRLKHRLAVYIMSPDEIHQENIEHYREFLKFDVLSLTTDRAVDFGKPNMLHPEDARMVLFIAKSNQVVGLFNYKKYDPKDEGIGYSFGRAMFIHNELMQRGFDRRAIKKAFVVGYMRTPDGGSWGYHVTTIAQSKDKNGKEIWLAIDPILNNVMTLPSWYSYMRNNFSVNKDIKLFITEATRFGPGKNSSYHEVLKIDKSYYNYFNHMMKWFDTNSRNGAYKRPLKRF